MACGKCGSKSKSRKVRSAKSGKAIPITIKRAKLTADTRISSKGTKLRRGVRTARNG